MMQFGEFPKRRAQAVGFFLFDVDDTVTQGGVLPSLSLLAMENLQQARIKPVAVTGRPAGWCDHMARMWPIDAVVGENGALWFSYDRGTKKMFSGYAKTESARASDRQRLDAVKKEILREVPGAAIATDQYSRIADLAIDFSEDVEPLSPGDVAKIVEIFEQAGATAKISSIHVNGWFGTYDKLSMTRTCLQQRFGVDIDAENASVLFVGDSPNDQPMFGFFENSVGVANVNDFDLEFPPTYVTKNRAAEGFAELVDKFLKLL